MRVRVRGSRNDHGRNLCDTCASHSCALGAAISQEIHYCSYFEDRLTWPVVHCTAHRPKGELTLYEMDHMALLIETKDDKIGFRRLTKDEIGDTKWR